MTQARNTRMHQYLDDWLIRARDRDTCFQNTRTLLALCQELGWVVNPTETAQTDLQFRRLPVRLSSRCSQAHPRKMGGSELQNHFSPKKDQLFSSTVHVLDRPSHSDRETGSIRMPPHEAHSMAPKDTLAHPGVLGKGHSDPQVPSSPPAVVVKGGKRSDRPTLAPPSSRSSDLYRRIKRRLRGTFRRLYRKRRLVSARKQTAHQFPRIESSLVGPESIRTPLPGLGSSGCYRQYYHGSLYQQRRRNAFGLPMCSPVEASVLVQSQGDLPESTSHSGPAQCDSRQTVSTSPSHSDGMVPSPGRLRSDLSQMAPSQTGPVCDQVQLQATPVCVPSTQPQGVGCGCLKPILGGSGPVCLSSGSSVDKCPDQSSQSSLQEDDNSGPGLAQYALVLGPGGDVLPNSGLSSQSPRSPDSAIQRQPSQGSSKFEPSCLAPRAQNIREQGFSDQVAERIEAPQRRSTRSVYEAKWAVFVRWCKAHQVDFHSPSVEQIADFLLHLFQDKKLQPSTVEPRLSGLLLSESSD